jgi:hypothetical protein
VSVLTSKQLHQRFNGSLYAQALLWILTSNGYGMQTRAQINPAASVRRLNGDAGGEQTITLASICLAG